MNRSSITILFLILVLATSQLILFACAGPQEAQESESRYIEGIVVEGGVHGFRMRDDYGNIIRFAARGDVEYQPKEFHAYYGDRVGVTYYMVIKKGEDAHKALKVVLLSKNPNRIEFRSKVIDGIIRIAGMFRHMVYLPEYDLTVPFNKSGAVKYTPTDWKPKEGDRVLIHFDQDSGRFVRNLIFDHMTSYDKIDAIEDKTESGIITEIFIHRYVHKVPERFAFKSENGNTWTMYAGGETKLVPKDLYVNLGGPYKINYYRKLMNDQSIRYVAAMIEGQRGSVPAELKYGVGVNSNEPWTGTWKIINDPKGSFVLKLKQIGSEVKSIRGSDLQLTAKVKGNRLKGTYRGAYLRYFDIKISEDFKSFQGGASFRQETYILKGERQD